MFKTLNNKALDDLNCGIVNELCKNARISTTEIGRRVGLSAPAVAERIQKLEELGYIRGYHALIDLDKVGLTIQAFVSLKATDLKHDALMKLVNSLPEIVEWHTVTGNATLLLKVVTASRKELAIIIQHLEDYGETSTSLILESNSETKNIEL